MHDEPPDSADEQEPELVLFLDECIPMSAKARLHQALQAIDSLHRIVVKHRLIDLPDHRDDGEWIPIVVQRGWLVVTADRGRRGAGTKLPILMQNAACDYVCLSGPLQGQKLDTKVHAIVACWPSILDLLGTLPPGRISIKRRPRGVGYTATKP